MAMIETDGLTKIYGSVTAVDGLTLSVKEGEVFGLLGPNGAGKTTTIRMLMGLSEPTSGKAVIGGRDCTREPLEVKRIVGYMPDNMGFYQDLTGRENLRFMGKLNGITDCEDRMERLLARVGMTYAADRKTSTYSRGMRQRLGIADALMKDPKVIILDEPTLGLDPVGVQELMKLIRELSTEDGRTVLISSHQLYQVQKICDRVGIFSRGKLRAVGNLEELKTQLRTDTCLNLELMTTPALTQRELENVEGAEQVTRDADGLWHISSHSDLRPAVLRMIEDRNMQIDLLRQSGSDLDDIYREFFEKEESSETAESVAAPAIHRLWRTVAERIRRPFAK